MRGENAGTLMGCMLLIGIVVFKVGVVIAVLYVAWHLISKYW